MTLLLVDASPRAAHAQALPAQATAESPASGRIQEVVVTARRRSELLTQAPVVVTAYTGNELAEKAITSVQGLAQTVPGVNISPGFLLDNMFIRGVGSSGDNAGFEEQVALFVDGVYYGNGHWVASAYFDIDEAQVLNGPQGVYFGKNTIAGALDITTKSPGHVLDGYLKVGHEFYADETYAEGAISVPISDTLAVRLAGRASTMQGWGDGPIGPGQPGTVHQPGIKDYVGRLTVAWNPTQSFGATLKVQGESYRDNGPEATDELIDCPGGHPAPLFIFGQTGYASCQRSFHFSTIQQTAIGNSFTRIPAYTVALNMHLKAGPGTLTSITGYNHYNLDSVGEFTQSNFDAVDGRNGNANSAFSQEVRYLTDLGGPLNFLGGVYYQWTGFHLYEAASILPFAVEGAPFSFYHTNGQHGTSLSGFAEAQWKIIPTLELDVGGRYTRETKNSFITDLPVPGLASFVGCVPPTTPSPSNPAPCIFPYETFTARQTFTNFSPQASLTWRPNSDFMAYAAYRTGFLSGGFNHTASITSTFVTADTTFGPEKTKGGEIGAKFYLDDRHVLVNADAYYYEYDGLQVNQFNPQTISQTVQNAASAVVKGVEANVTWLLDGGFRLYGSVAYNHSRYQNYIGSCLPTEPSQCTVQVSPGVFEQNFSGRATNFAPDWAGRVELNYKRAFAGGDYTLNATVGANLETKYIVQNVLNEPGHVLLDGNVSIDHGP